MFFVNRLCIVFSLVLIFIQLSSAVLVAREDSDSDCTGIDILYPIANTTIKRSEEEVIYLILGTKLPDAVIDRVLILRKENEKIFAKRAWKGNKEPMSKITALQQPLSRFSSTLPDQFWFRADIHQNGKECHYVSEKFEIVA
ncbi:hypothetical protein BDF14DRAFT_1839960 [Spinellus fusiger]|nr:hypothetical protein BDF14DRAFT_1839960 [Spinellus fusiger]